MSKKVLFSFSGKDLERLKIKEIAYALEKQPDIEHVFIYTRDTSTEGEGDIIKYMQNAVEKCDIVVLFCTANSAESDPVFLEWGTSQYLGKPIIPVAENSEYIPTLLKKRLRVKISEEIVHNNFIELINEISEIINSSMTEIPNKNTPPKKFDEQFLLEKAIISRKNYNENCLHYFNSLPEDVKQAIKEKSPLIGEENFSYPATKELLQNVGFFDTICSLVSYEGDKILIIPSGISNNDVEGVGRTNLLLRLLGYEIKYNRLFGLSEPNKKIQLDLKEHSKFSLLASDMLYLGLADECLCVVPTRGEVISFIWDIARNIFRSSEIDYEKDRHRKEGRPKLKKIFENIELSSNFVKNAYGQMDEFYFPNKVYILKRDLGRFLKPPTISKIRNKEEIKQKLETALLISLKHGSDFWCRDAEKIKKQVKDIVNGLALSSIELYEIKITFPDPRLPPYIFDDINEIFQKGSIEENVKGEISNKFEIGIRYHNYRVYERLSDVYELDLLVTSGQKFFNDISIWEKLSKGKRELKFNILFLDPNSDAAKEREQQAYKKYKKKQGFLREEILENVDEIKRMANYLKKNYNTNIKVDCRLYSEKPIFRMTFINNKTLLLATYPENKRTGAKTKFFIINKDEQEELYQAFKNEYTRIFAHATPLK